MSKRRGRRRGGRRSYGLNGVSAKSKGFTAKKAGMTLLGTAGAVGLAIAGGSLGSLLQNWAWAGVAPLAIGLYMDESNQGDKPDAKKKRYIGKALTLIGVGSIMSLGTGKPVSAATNGLDGEMECFDLEKGKQKMNMFLNNFKESIKLPGRKAQVDGFGDTPAYFMNPAGQPIDMSELDRISENIAAMNGGLSGEDDFIERDF